MRDPSISVDVVVPTYRRPRELGRCLAALARQTRPPDRVIVVSRMEDAQSQAVVHAAASNLATVELVIVSKPGVIAAMSAGVAASTAVIVAFTDDDAAPRPDWVERLLIHFQDQGVGAVGGRDVIPGQDGPLTTVVGTFDRWGRLRGNHHLGTGAARDVDVLKGVNVAFRAKALALPAPGRLRGSGAEVDWEVLSCAHLLRQGWRIVYDPRIVVDHDAAPRHGPDRRVRPEHCAVLDAAHNSIIASSAFDRGRALRAVFFTLLVGTRDRPGPLQALVAVARGDGDLLRRLPPAMAGKVLATLHLVVDGLLPARPLAVTATTLRDSQERPQVALIAHDVRDRGGMERACAELIRHAHHEFAFTVVSAELAPELRPLVGRWIRVRVPKRPFPLKFVAFFGEAGSVLHRLEVDLVHTVGAIVPNRVDVASIHFCHAGHRAATGRLAPAGAPPLRRANTTLTRALALLAERWSYRLSHLRAFAAVSDGVAEELEDHYPAVPVVVTPNGIDIERFHPDPAERRVMRDQHGLGTEQCLALFLGGDWDRKGLALAVEAIAKARADGADVVLWVVGDGDRARFASLAEELGVGEAVTFFGPRADTERFYQAADLLVLPSAYETFSLVCFEAAACGLPLVIPPLHGAGQLVGDDEAGLIVERDAADIARAIVELTGDHDLRSRLGAEASLRASAFTWDASAIAVTDLYRMLLDERSRR